MVLSGAYGLAAAGRLRRGGRSFAATFLIGSGAPLPAAAIHVAQRGVPLARRERLVRVVALPRGREAPDDPLVRRVQ